MKLFRKIIASAIITLFILSLTISIRTEASVNLGLISNSGNISNVAVIFFITDAPYTMRLIESLKKIENENKNKVKYTFLNPKNNIAIQNEILDTALQSNYDLFILYLPDKKENIVEDVIIRVKQKNKPLILMNIPQEVVSKTSKLYDKVTFVIPDSKKAGITQGKIVVDLWKNNKKVLDKNGDDVLQYVLLQGPSDDPQVVDRTKYAIATINESGIKTQEIAIVKASWFKDLAKTSIDNLFLKYNGSIEAIISNNDAMAIGAIEALQNYGYNKENENKKVVVVGIDGLSEAKDLINNLNPTENTNYKVVEGTIIIPFPYETYIGKLNAT